MEQKWTLMGNLEFPFTWQSLLIFFKTILICFEGS